MDDISKRLKEKAKQDRIKLIAGASIMAIVILAVLYGTGITVGNLMEAVNIVALAVVALFAGAVLLLLRLVKKMEADSFDEGMHIVMESVPMVCSLLNKDSSIVYCNDQAPKLLDLTSKQEYMSRFFELMPEYQPDGSLTKEKAGQVMKAAFGTGRYVFEWERKKPNGELLPLEVTLVRLSFQGEDHLLEFTRDVSEAHENKKKEQALKAKMQAILDASPLVCAVFNEEGKIEEVNREAENMFALPDRQIFVDRYHEFLPEFQPDGTRSTDKDQQVLKAVMQKGSYRHEQTYRLRDGTLVP
ncbi:MAG: PAS domain-containing protein, partial [Treponema sp.]|nr:PAS domain-containing protein [Treponema sp.]